MHLLQLQLQPQLRFTDVAVARTTLHHLDILFGADTQANQLCSAFLREFWPPSDAKDLSHDYIEETVDLALQARGASSWAQDVPWPLFLNYVLPYARCSRVQQSSTAQSLAQLACPAWSAIAQVCISLEFSCAAAFFLFLARSTGMSLCRQRLRPATGCEQGLI